MSNAMDLVLGMMWFILPSAIANSVPPLGRYLFPNVDYPMDFNATLRGKRVFGAHKTIRGFLLGVISAGIIFALQKVSYVESSSIRELSLWNYAELPMVFGYLLGIGALMGDALKSFFKRQLNIQPGKSWIPWDQIDWLIGTLLVMVAFIPVSLSQAAVLVLLGVFGHLSFKVIGYFLKINKDPI